MNRRRLIITVAGLAILIAAIAWLMISMGISVELEVALPGVADANDPTVRSVRAINGALAWLIPAGLVAIFSVGGFFFFRELLKQRAYDRRKPPN